MTSWSPRSQSSLNHWFEYAVISLITFIFPHLSVYKSLNMFLKSTGISSYFSSISQWITKTFFLKNLPSMFPVHYSQTEQIYSPKNKVFAIQFFVHQSTRLVFRKINGHSEREGPKSF